jgi:hypothetical protein
MMPTPFRYSQYKQAHQPDKDPVTNKQKKTHTGLIVNVTFTRRARIQARMAIRCRYPIIPIWLIHVSNVEYKGD